MTVTTLGILGLLIFVSGVFFALQMTVWAKIAAPMPFFWHVVIVVFYVCSAAACVLLLTKHGII